MTGWFGQNKSGQRLRRNNMLGCQPWSHESGTAAPGHTCGPLKDDISGNQICPIRPCVEFHSLPRIAYYLRPGGRALLVTPGWSSSWPGALGSIRTPHVRGFDQSSVEQDMQSPMSESPDGECRVRVPRDTTNVSPRSGFWED